MRSPKVTCALASTLLLVGAGSIAACDAHPTAVASDPTAVEAADVRSDGIEIYRAVFFGEGELVRALPSPWRERGRSAPTAEQARAERLKAEVLAWIDASEPAFFTELGTAIRSGDHVQVERMLDRSSELTVQALHNVADEREARWLGGMTPAYAEEPCAVFAVIWIAAYIKTYVWVVEEEQDSRTAASALSRDELVHALATSLSTRS